MTTHSRKICRILISSRDGETNIMNLKYRWAMKLQVTKLSDCVAVPVTLPHLARRNAAPFNLACFCDGVRIRKALCR